jgi:heme A synthase
MPHAADTPVPRWLHYWAILTVAAAVVLLPLGALVTTLRAGMADPVWPTTPWYLVVTPWRELRLDFLIEHSHRFAAYVVGCCAIVLAAGSWLRSPRWLTWLGTSALLAVIAQGVLGGYRVLLDRLFGPEMAAAHGVFGALVFSLLVGVAVLTGRPPAEALDEAERRRFTRLALLVAAVVLVQLAFGALLRHTYRRIGPRLHLLGAFAVLAAAVWLAAAVRESPSARKRLGRSVSVLLLFVAVQLALGVEAWLSKFAQGMYFELQPAPTLGQVAVRTAHFLLGSCILAASVATALLARRSPAPAPDIPAAPAPWQARPLEAATAVTTGTSTATQLEGTA